MDGVLREPCPQETNQLSRTADLITCNEQAPPFFFCAPHDDESKGVKKRRNSQKKNVENMLNIGSTKKRKKGGSLLYQTKNYGDSASGCPGGGVLGAGGRGSNNSDLQWMCTQFLLIQPWSTGFDSFKANISSTQPLLVTTKRV